jgi:tetratricopeptide (TPR) repeat protein
MRTAALILAVGGLLAASARAADPQVEKAVTAYDDFEYQKAIGLLQQALKTNLDAADRVKARLYLGLSYFTLGNQKEAGEAFRKALEENYQAELPADTSPKIIEFFQKIKASLPAPRKEPEKVVGTETGGGTGVGIVEKKPPPPPPKRLWTWVALGAGGTLVAGGAVFAYLASSAKSDFDKEPWADRAADLKSTAESRALTANVLLGTGGAAMVAGLVLFFVEGGKYTAQSSSQPISVHFGPAGFDVLIRF